MFARRHITSASGFWVNWMNRLSHNAPQDSIPKQLYTPAQRGTSPPIAMPPTTRIAHPPGSNRERFTTLIFYAVVILLIYLCYLIFAPFLVPLAWGAIFVVLFHPWHEHLARRWGNSGAAALSTVGVTLVLIVPTLALTSLFVREAFQAALGMQLAFSQGHLPWVNNGWNWLLAHSPGGTGRDLSSVLSQAGNALGSRAAEMLSLVLQHTALFFFDLFVTLFALFFLFRDGAQLMESLHGVLPFETSSRERMFHGARDLIRASVTTSLVIAALQGIMCGAAFWITGISAPIFWGVGMAFCSLLPVIGSAIIWAPAAIWLFSTGHWGQAIVLLAICAGLTSVADSLLRPMLLSGRAQLNGLVVFISVLGGVAVFGAIGLVLGPIVVATAKGLLDAYSHPPPAAG
jgi:predicted PurR-regulated permease PerM